jgi:hypothetical protein
MTFGDVPGCSPAGEHETPHYLTTLEVVGQASTRTVPQIAHTHPFPVDALDAAVGRLFRCGCRGFRGFRRRARCGLGWRRAREWAVIRFHVG